jgi:hypothetical protein
MATYPKQVLEAAHAVENLSEQSLAVVAQSKGLTVAGLLQRLDLKLFELAEGGDLEALRMLRERMAGSVLGPLDRVRSARRLARRVEKALGRGQISIAEAAKLVQLVRVRRELEHDDLDQRLAEVEGSLVRVDG